MTDEPTLDLDDPDVQAEAERRYNIYYRLMEADDVDFSPGDFFLLGGGFEYLTDDELMEVGKVSLKIEMEGREGLSFTTVTEYERELAALVKKGIERYKENETITSDDFPDGIGWDGERVIPER